MRYGYGSLLLVGLALAGCVGPTNTLPPAQQLMHPGPGVDGPGPGVMMYQPPVAAPAMTSQVAFAGPEGMAICWDITAPGAFDSEPLIAPGRYNFPQAAIYRLKLANIPGRPGVELYPTLELGPTMPRTQAFLAHNAIPVGFTEEDFDQCLSGNFVTKVIYLPDPEFQELALAGVETLVSTRLDPGVDPIVEADRRGSIMAIIRMGNKDLEVPGQGGPMGVAGGAGPAIDPVTGAPLPPGMGGAMPASYVAGVTAPQWGMPSCGTPIGLAGPPHIPMGGQAGLRKHTMVNHTCVNIPEPNKQMRIDVRQDPGISYPKPANHAWIVEQPNTLGIGNGLLHQPVADKRQMLNPDGTPCADAAVASGTACPTGQYPVQQ